MDTTTKKGNSSMFARSADTTVLAELLATVAEGDTITYETLSNAIGRDVTDHARSNLTSARRIVEHEKGLVFGAVWKVGLERLPPRGVVKLARDGAKRQSRGSRRILRRLGTVEYGRLEQSSRCEYLAQLALHGVIAQATSVASIRRLERGVEPSETPKTLPVKQTLEFLTQCLGPGVSSEEAGSVGCEG